MKVNKTKKRDDAWNFVCNCYDHHPGDTNEEKTEIKMSEYRSEYRIVVTVHTPLSREVFWHEYAKIPRHTSQNSIAAGNLE